MPVLPLLWMAPLLSGGGYSSEAIAFALGLRNETRRAGAPSVSLGVRQFAEQQDDAFVDGLPQSVVRTLQPLFVTGARSRAARGVVICHSTPDAWVPSKFLGWDDIEPCPPAEAAVRVGRTMFETSSVPLEWVERCNAMDEVWVPTPFHVASFAAAGVARDKLFVIGEPVDAAFFDPTKHAPLALPPIEVATDPAGPPPAAPPFRFLSVFKWEARKGWDVLIEAYFAEPSPLLQRARQLPTPTPARRPAAPPALVIGQRRAWRECVASMAATRHLRCRRAPGAAELLSCCAANRCAAAEPPPGRDRLAARPRRFGPLEEVQLLLKTKPFHSDGDFEREIDRLAAARGLPGAAARPALRLLDAEIPLASLPRLYAAADAFVLPSRGEGWGRPHCEAMAMGLPVIATNWSGPTAYLSEETGYPLGYTLAPMPAEMNLPGHEWAEPDVRHLRSLLREAFSHRVEGRRRGAAARRLMLERFSPAALAREVLARVATLAQAADPRGARDEL